MVQYILRAVPWPFWNKPLQVSALHPPWDALNQRFVLQSSCTPPHGLAQVDRAHELLMLSLRPRDRHWLLIIFKGACSMLLDH